jgi:hypothetical protein
MMKITHGAIVPLALGLALLFQSSSQSNVPTNAGEPLVPEAVNLEITPDEPEDPAEARDKELARFAIRDPGTFHDALARLDPGRVGREHRAANAILDPVGFRRAFPKGPDEIRAEAIAAHAILNIPMILPSLIDRP